MVPYLKTQTIGDHLTTRTWVCELQRLLEAYKSMKAEGAFVSLASKHDWNCFASFAQTLSLSLEF